MKSLLLAAALALTTLVPAALALPATAALAQDPPQDSGQSAPPSAMPPGAPGDGMRRAPNPAARAAFDQYRQSRRGGAPGGPPQSVPVPAGQAAPGL